MSAQAQSNNDENEEADEIEEEIPEPKFFDGIENERFKSDLSNIEESRKIDYSKQNHSKNTNRFELNIFGKDGDVPKYQSVENENTPNQPYNRVMIGSEGAYNNNINSTNPETPNSNSSSIKNPFSTSPAVKAPRNMDAVPDNDADPNDIPVDGGLSLLGVTAALFGYKKFQNRKAN